VCCLVRVEQRLHLLLECVIALAGLFDPGGARLGSEIQRLVKHALQSLPVIGTHAGPRHDPVSGRAPSARFSQARAMVH
jgi:hypothetical protein